MTEKMLEVKVEELSTVRLVFGHGVVHEIPLDSVDEYAADCHDGDLARHLTAPGPRDYVPLQQEDRRLG